MRSSPVAGVYDKTVDRESAYEKLAEPRRRVGGRSGVGAPAAGGGSWIRIKGSLGGLMTGSGRKDSLVEAMAKSAVRTIGSTVGREIVRGVLGSLLGRAPPLAFVPANASLAARRPRACATSQRTS